MSGRSAATPHAEWSTYTSKSFITTKAFSTELYSYTLTRSGTPPFAATGSLLVSGASAANCPAGRVLHTNGKKLTPGANPMNAFTGGATVTAAKFMIGVYDPESMLNGYIDPTSPTFAVYDKNRPAADYLIDFTGATAEATALAALGGQGANLLTTSAVNVPITSASNLAIAATATASSRAGSVSFVAASNDAVTTVTVTNTTVKSTSIVILTSSTVTPVCVSAVSDGSFVITTTAAAANRTVRFLVIN